VSVVIERDLTCTLPDHVVLAADVYRPAGNGRWPVLLMRTPYNKGLMPLISQSLDAVKAAEAGFAVVVQDVRGRHASQGEGFQPYEHEGADGRAAVEWCAELPFSNGQIGMFGVSYMGGACWLAAAARPAPLKAIATAHAPRDLYAGLRPGGALAWATAVDWSVGTVGIDVLVRRGGPDLMDRLGALFDDVDGFPDRIGHRPLTSFPPAHPEHPELLGFFWDYVSHETRDEAWARGLYPGALDEAEVPALVLAGWHDMMLRDDVRHFVHRGRPEDRLVVGPWAHGVFDQVVGDVDFGLRAGGLSLDLQGDVTSLQVSWFDRWLRDGEGAAQPRVKVFVQGMNRWRSGDAWPLAEPESTALFLTGNGGLEWTAPVGAAAPSAFRYDPDNPCPTLGGALIAPLTYRRGPVDQRPLLEREDVLLFQSAPLTDPLHLMGEVRAVLHAATDGPDTDWVVKLCDVHPDGRVLNLCDGIQRASARDADTRHTPVVAGELVRYDVDLGPTAVMVPAGHRLAVLVTSSDFPRYDRNPNTGEGSAHVTARVASQAVHHEPGAASLLLLPVVPKRD